MTYKHLTPEERDRLAVLKSRGLPLREIAEQLGRAASSLCRELKRNRPERGRQDYLPHKAQGRAEDRQRTGHKRMRLKSRVLRFEVEKHLQMDWTPELISGQFKKYRMELPRISPEAIYQWIYAEAPHLIGTLPRSHPRRRMRRFARKGKKVIIPQRISITERPACVQERKEPGHWESDLMIGRGKCALQNNTERVSRFIKIAKVADKTAAQARSAIARALKPLPAHLRRSVTYDNGTENAEHHLLNQEIGSRSFFCEPYHSWEKGTVENKNGVIRRFFPKKTNFDIIADDDIRRVEDHINNRPMKCLNFKTPAQVFTSLVALAG